MGKNRSLTFFLGTIWVSTGFEVFPCLSNLFFEVPPPELLISIFPWVEEEELALADRIVQFGKVAKDEALSYFLALLKYLRKVLIQDAAVLCSVYPSLPILYYFE